jgi:hypothetical protein
MSDAELIQTVCKEITEAIDASLRYYTEHIVKETLQRFGLDMSKDDDEISQNQADKIIGRAERTRGKLSGAIRFTNKSEGRFGRVMLSRADVMKIKNCNKFNKR